MNTRIPVKAWCIDPKHKQMVWAKLPNGAVIAPTGGAHTLLLRKQIVDDPETELTPEGFRARYDLPDRRQKMAKTKSDNYALQRRGSAISAISNKWETVYVGTQTEMRNYFRDSIAKGSDPDRIRVIEMDFDTGRLIRVVEGSGTERPYGTESVEVAEITPDRPEGHPKLFWRSSMQPDDVLVGFSSEAEARAAKQILSTVISDMGGLPMAMTASKMEELQRRVAELMVPPLTGISMRVFQDGHLQIDRWIFDRNRIPRSYVLAADQDRLDAEFIRGVDEGLTTYHDMKQEEIDKRRNEAATQRLKELLMEDPLPTTTEEEKTMSEDKSRLTKTKDAAVASASTLKDEFFDGIKEAAVEEGADSLIDIVMEGTEDMPMVQAMLNSPDGREFAKLFAALALFFVSATDMVPGIRNEKLREVQRIIMKSTGRNLAKPRFKKLSKMFIRLAKAAMKMDIPEDATGSMFLLDSEEPMKNDEFTSVESRKKEKVAK